MKKILLVAFLALGTAQVQAQNIGDIANTIQTIQKVNNVASTAKNIANTLKLALGLNKGQGNKLTNIFSSYLKNTNGIANLANSDMATYAAKLAGFNTNTIGQIKGVLTAAQYAKLLGLGNSSNNNAGSAASLLSGLGALSGKNTDNTSDNTMNIITGLLNAAK